MTVYSALEIHTRKQTVLNLAVQSKKVKSLTALIADHRTLLFPYFYTNDHRRRILYTLLAR